MCLHLNRNFVISIETPHLKKKLNYSTKDYSMPKPGKLSSDVAKRYKVTVFKVF